MNQTNKTFGNTMIFIELTDGNAKKKGEDEKRFHRNGVERRNLFCDGRIFVPVGTEPWFEDRWIYMCIYY